ncbi:MAG: hypothetical protein AB7V27_10690 [Candidatus Binatia bacterium]
MRDPHEDEAPTDRLIDGVAAEDGIVAAADPFQIVNEFTAIQVRKVRTRNGERLELLNLRSGTRILLDAMQLEIIAAQRPEVFTSLLATSQ